LTMVEVRRLLRYRRTRTIPTTNTMTPKTARPMPMPIVELSLLPPPPLCFATTPSMVAKPGGREGGGGDGGGEYTSFIPRTGAVKTVTSTANETLKLWGVCVAINDWILPVSPSVTPGAFTMIVEVASKLPVDWR